MGAIDIGELRGIITLSDQFSGPIENVGKSLGITGASFGALAGAAGLVAGAIAGAAAAVVAMGKQGAVIDDVNSAFNALSASAGISAEVMLGKMTEGVKGTVSNFELMKLANKALGAGLIKTAEDMGTLSQGARLLAKRTGGDTKEAFETLSSAIASGRTASLKQIGLFVDSKVATENYATSLHKTVSQLTDSERAQALSQGTLAKLREEFAKNAPPAADFGEIIERGKTHFANFTDALSVAIATSPVVQAGMDAMGKALDEAFGGNQQNLVKTLIGYVNDFAIFVAKAASVAVEAARFISNGWDGLKFLFNETLSLLMSGVAMVDGAIASVIEAASAIPGAPEWIKDTAKQARATADSLDAMAKSFDEQAEEALDAAGKHNAALDSVQAVIGKTISAMEAAKNSTVELATATGQTLPKAAAEGAKRTVEESHKIKEAFAQLQRDISAAQTDGLDGRLQELENAREKEIAGLVNLKDLSGKEYDALVELINEKYDLMGQKATETSQQVLDTTLKLQQDLALANTTGIEKRLLELDIAHQNEIDSLIHMVGSYGTEYDELAALVDEKYQHMRDVALMTNDTIAQSAAAAGFKTRADLEETAARAHKLYDEMLASGQFTYGQLKAAHEAAEKADEDLDDKRKLSALQKFELIASSASAILRSLFGKSKAAAIAAAVIDTAAAVAKTLAQYPWPFSLAPAAAALAAGIAQVNQIRSTDAGFRAGTPDMSFRDFGRGSATMLHGPEAVVTQVQARSLTDFVDEGITRAMGRGGGAGDMAVFNLSFFPGGEVFDRMVMRRNRAGLLTLERAGA